MNIRHFSDDLHHKEFRISNNRFFCLTTPSQNFQEIILMR
jgi:hypothetical protein